MKVVFSAIFIVIFLSSCDFIDNLFFRGTFEAVERCAVRNTGPFISLFESRNRCAQSHQYIVGEFLDHQISGSARLINLTYSNGHVIQLSLRNNYEKVLVTQLEIGFIFDDLPDLRYFIVSDLWIEPNKTERQNISEQQISQAIGQTTISSNPSFSAWGVQNVWGIRAKKF